MMAVRADPAMIALCEMNRVLSPVVMLFQSLFNLLSASFFNPTGITTDGINLYVTDGNNFLIRKIVISTGTRAMSQADAQAQNQKLSKHIFGRESYLPILQVDSRLRGIGNALRGIYQSLDFDFLLIVPAEPELGRLVQGGCYYHVEEGRLIAFHQSVLAKSAEPPFATSDLREFIAGELGMAQDRVVSIGTEVVSRGPDAVVDFVDDQHVTALRVRFGLAAHAPERAFNDAIADLALFRRHRP